MLRFSTASWFGALVVFRGGVLPRLLGPTACYVAYVCAMYLFCSETKFSLSTDGLKFIAAATTFMLVFRLNQCYSRLTHATQMLVDAIRSLRGIVGMTCCALGYGERNQELSEAERRAATMTKVHVCRLAVAFAVSLKFHLRVAEMMNQGSSVDESVMRLALYDLLRVKRLLTRSEAKLVESYSGLYEAQEDGFYGRRARYTVDIHRLRLADDGGAELLFHSKSQQAEGGTGCAVPPFIIQLLRHALLQPLGQSWGYPERAMNVYETLIGHATQSFQEMNQMVLFSLPLPYVQLCKVLLTVFIMAYPLSIDIHHGVWGNVVVPSVLAFAMLGFEIVADFMENPLGDDSSDISIYESIHEFEVEAQAIFNSSLIHRPGLSASEQELAEEFGLKTDCLREWADDGPPDFNDFFEWSPLPSQLVNYIRHQSTDAAALNTWASLCSLAGCCCCARRRRSGVSQARVGGDAEEEDSVTYTELTLSEFDHDRSGSDADRFAVRRCLALRSSLPHMEAAKRQLLALEGQDLRRLASFQDVLTKAGLARDE